VAALLLFLVIPSHLYRSNLAEEVEYTPLSGSQSILKEVAMATYLMLLNWTDQGIRNIQESPKRMDAAKKLAKDFGGEIKTVYMTQGTFDLALVAEMPSDQKTAGFVLKLGSLGNVRTTTLKAYSEDDYRTIIGGLN
jgi:uncharacterized protein with GYD domain